MRFAPTISLLAVVIAGLLAGPWVVPAAANPSIYEPDRDPGLGVLLISWANFGASGVQVWEDAIDDVHAHGFTHVTICPLRFVDLTTGAVRQSDGSTTAPDASHIEAAVARAKSLGMNVTLNPFVEPDGFAIWRGSMDFAGPAKATFWQDYANYVVEVATLAQAQGADAMTVGSELKALVSNAGHNAEWAALIAAVDAAFGGAIGYASNWDNYRHPNLTATIWEHAAIDFLGVDTYHPLASSAAARGAGLPGVSLLETAWTSVFDTPAGGFNHGILAYASARKAGLGMPAVLTEHGAIPYDETTVAPYSQAAAANPPDPEEQRNDYEALLRAADGRRLVAQATGQLDAIFIWQWGMPGATGSKWFLDPEGDPVTDGATAAAYLVDFNATAPIAVPIPSATGFVLAVALVCSGRWQLRTATRIRRAHPSSDEAGCKTYLTSA